MASPFPRKTQRLTHDGTDKQTPATYVVLMEGEVVGGQHSDAQAGAQSGVQEAPNDGLVLWAQQLVHPLPTRTASP